jgi:hypothetical protein
MIPHEHIRNKYYRSAKAESKRMLNIYRADFMTRIANAQSIGDIQHEADKAISDEHVVNLMVKIYSGVGSRFARATIKDVNTKKAAGDLDYWIEYFKIYARTKLANKIAWITNTTEEVFKDIVRRLSEQAGSEGWSIAHLRNEIQNEIGFSNAYRAERIARTEIVAASNVGTLEGAKQAGIPTKKKWLPIVDQFSRPSHAAMEGSPAIGLDEAFIIDGESLMQPGDGSAEQCINCRCALDIVPDTSYEEILNR